MRTNFLSILFFSYMFHVTSSVIIADNLRTHKFVFMPKNWLTVPILTLSSWNTYDQISFLTSKNNCDNTTRKRAFYIQYETGEEKKKTWSFQRNCKQEETYKDKTAWTKSEDNTTIKWTWILAKMETATKRRFQKRHSEKLDKSLKSSYAEVYLWVKQ